MRMKKKRHGEDRLKILSSFFCDDIKKAIDNREDIFGNGNPVRIEIGCGKGDFIRQKAVKEPDYNYIAIEKISDVCIIAAEKYAISRNLGRLADNGGWEKEDKTIIPYGESTIFTTAEMGNVRFCVGNALSLLSELDESCIESVYINFCDPWAKKGYAKRRLTYIEFLNMYSKILINGGKLCFKTDNIGLFDFSLEEIKKSNFVIDFKVNDLHSSEYAKENIMTEYEKNFSEKGFLINMLIATNKK